MDQANAILPDISPHPYDCDERGRRLERRHREVKQGNSRAPEFFEPHPRSLVARDVWLELFPVKLKRDLGNVALDSAVVQLPYRQQDWNRLCRTCSVAIARLGNQRHGLSQPNAFWKMETIDLKYASGVSRETISRADRVRRSRRHGS